MNPEPQNTYWRAPAIWLVPTRFVAAGFTAKSGWVLYRETVFQVNDSGWTKRSTEEFPEILAHKLVGERKWKKGPPNLHQISQISYKDIDDSRREKVHEQEVVAILLMASK